MVAWAHISSLADEQHGVIGRDQLAALGVSKSALQVLADQRHLERSVPRVWRVVGAPITWRQRLHTGLLALGPMSWVSHDAAAALHRFDRTPPERVEFLVLRNKRCADIGLKVHATRRWSRVDAVVVDGLRTTSATRTVLDLANVRVSPDRLKAAIDTAVRLELSSPEALKQRLDAIRSRGRTGVRIIDELIVDSGGHTMLERKFLELMTRAGLPRPKTQVIYRTASSGRFVARVDFAYPELGLVVEVSGKLGHSSPSERARDAQRRNELQDLGIRVYEFTWEDVTDRSMYVMTRMRALLAASAA